MSQLELLSEISSEESVIAAWICRHAVRPISLPRLHNHAHERLILAVVGWQARSCIRVTAQIAGGFRAQYGRLSEAHTCEPALAGGWFPTLPAALDFAEHYLPRSRA